MRESRLTEIRTLLYQKKEVSIQELCDRMNVSVETIRRDLNRLESEGTIRKTYGGAIFVESQQMPNAMQDWDLRYARNIKEKTAIARLALNSIPDNCTLCLDSGTTLYCLATMLNVKKNLTILTNSLHIATELGRNSDHQVNCIGGTLKSKELINVGLLATNYLECFASIDIAVVSTDGFSDDTGFSDHSLEMATLKRIMLRKAKKRIALLDHSKFGCDALFSTSSVSDMDVIVTDNQVPADEIERLREKGSTVLVAPV